MKRFVIAFVAAGVGAALGVWAVSSRQPTSNRQQLDPSEDPRNAIVGPEKIHPVTADMVRATAKLAKQEAPDFALIGDDGRTYRLRELARTKPVVLFFIVNLCPCCVTARPYIGRVNKAYQGAATFLGVIDGDAKTAKLWARNNAPGFPILADPKLGTIRSYHAKRGTYMTLIAPGGTIDKVYPGYSQSLVTELGRRIAALAGTPEKTIEVADLPKEATTGCPFNVPE
jgi:peroxiredoxin